MDRSVLDAASLQAALDSLNQGTAKAWEIREDKLHKVFVFSNFSAAFGFMTRAAMMAECLDHHPEWCNVYSSVAVNLSTHDAGGITALDFELATRMEGLME